MVSTLDRLEKGKCLDLAQGSLDDCNRHRTNRFHGGKPCEDLHFNGRLARVGKQRPEKLASNPSAEHFMRGWGFHFWLQHLAFGPI